MGRGDKKSAKGKRTKGSYGVARNRKKIKAKLLRTASKKKVVAGAEVKPKAKKAAKK